MNTMRFVAGLLFSLATFLSGGLYADGTFVPRYEERDYQGSLEQRAQEAIIVYKDGVEDLILKVTYHGKPKDFAWVIPFPSVPEISRESADLFSELFAYVEHALAEESKEVWFGCGMKAKEEEAPGVEVIAKKLVGTYETTTVRETTKGALNRWLNENGYVELKGAEEQLDYYRQLNWAFVAIKVREAVAGDETVDLHPLRFKFTTPRQDETVYPLKLSVFQNVPMDVNLYVFTDSMVNVAYDDRGVLTKGFDARYHEKRFVRWSHNRIEDGPLLTRTRQFFLKNYPRERFYLTNIQARDLHPSEIREWSEDLYVYPQYVHVFDPSTWCWPHWLALLVGIGVVVVIVGVLIRLHRRKRPHAA